MQDSHKFIRDGKDFLQLMSSFFGRALTRKGDGRTRQTYKRIKRGNVQKHYVEARETRFAPPVWDTGVTD